MIDENQVQDKRTVLDDNSKRVGISRFIVVMVSLSLVPASLYGLLSVWAFFFAFSLAYFFRQRLLKIIYTYLHFENNGNETQTLSVKRKIAWFLRGRISLLMVEMGLIAILPLLLFSLLPILDEKTLPIIKESFDRSISFYDFVSDIDFVSSNVVPSVKNLIVFAYYFSILIFSFLAFTALYRVNYEVSNRNMFVFTARPFRYRSYGVCGVGVMLLFALALLAAYKRALLNLNIESLIGVGFIAYVLLICTVFIVYAVFPICGSRRVGEIKTSKYKILNA
jgi:hypothetical protein